MCLVMYGIVQTRIQVKNMLNNKVIDAANNVYILLSCDFYQEKSNNFITNNT